MSQDANKYMNITDSIPYMKDQLGSSMWIDPLDWCYYSNITRKEWRKSKLLAKRLTETLATSSYLDFVRSYGPVEKAGEYVFKNYLDYYCGLSYDVNFAEQDPYVPGFGIGSKTINVHTRMLKLGEQACQYGPFGRLINTTNFLLMVPEFGLMRKADIYVFCGFDVYGLEGYTFGWLSAQELGNIEMRQDVKFPAKCVLIPEVHPMKTLFENI